MEKFHSIEKGSIVLINVYTILPMHVDISSVPVQSLYHLASCTACFDTVGELLPNHLDSHTIPLVSSAII